MADLALSVIYSLGKAILEKRTQIKGLSRLADRVTSDLTFLYDTFGQVDHLIEDSHYKLEIRQCFEQAHKVLVKGFPTESTKIKTWLTASDTEASLGYLAEDLKKYRDRFEALKTNAIIQGQKEASLQSMETQKKLAVQEELLSRILKAKDEERSSSELRDLQRELSKLSAQCQQLQMLIDEKSPLVARSNPDSKIWQVFSAIGVTNSRQQIKVEEKKSLLASAMSALGSAKKMLSSSGASGGARTGTGTGTGKGVSKKLEQVREIKEKIVNITLELNRLQAEHCQLCMDLCITTTETFGETLSITWDKEVMPLWNKLSKSSSAAVASIKDDIATYTPSMPVLPQLPQLPPQMWSFSSSSSSAPLLPTHNSEGRPVWLGGAGGSEFASSGGDTNLDPSKVFYCGAKMRQCRCGGCDGQCGPQNGCPCNSCRKLLGDLPDTSMGEVSFEDEGGDGSSYTYKGYLKNGRPNGRGCLTLSTGEEYDGDFEDCELVSGRMQLPCGQCYEGGFLDLQPSGQGRMEWSDGSFYQGGWHEGEFHGMGEWYDAADGERYCGNFRYGAMHGQGSHYYRGITREGMWIDNLFQGDD